MDDWNELVTGGTPTGVSSGVCRSGNEMNGQISTKSSGAQPCSANTAGARATARATLGREMDSWRPTALSESP